MERGSGESITLTVNEVSEKTVTATPFNLVVLDCPSLPPRRPGLKRRCSADGSSATVLDAPEPGHLILYGVRLR